MVKETSAIYLYAGSAEYLKDRAIDEFKRALPGGTDIKTFRADEAEAIEITEHLATPSLFSTHRLIILKAFSSLAKKDRAILLSHISKLPSQTTVIIDARDESVLSESEELAKKIVIKRFNVPTEDEVRPWILRACRNLNKRISDEAAMLLQSLHGTRLDMQEKELEKLSLYIGEREEITLDDVELLSGRSAAESAFDLVWIIDKGDVPGSMQFIQDLYKSGKRPHEIVGLITWHLKRLLTGFDELKRGQSEFNISRTLKLAKRFQGPFFKMLKSLKRSDIIRKLEVLCETDRELKRGKLGQELSLELAVLKLCLRS